MRNISTIKKNFKNILKKLLAEKGYDDNTSDTALEKELKIHRTTIGNYRNKDTVPNLKSCIKLAKYFDVSISYLLGETELRKADNIVIGEKLGIDDQAIQNIESIKRFNQTFNNRYNDIFSDIFTNVDLYKNVVNGIDEMLQYKFDKINSPTIPKEKLNLEHYTELLACQKFLERYHIYNEKKLFDHDILNFGKERLLQEINELELKLRIAKNRLKAYK